MTGKFEFYAAARLAVAPFFEREFAGENDGKNGGNFNEDGGKNAGENGEICAQNSGENGESPAAKTPPPSHTKIKNCCNFDAVLATLRADYSGGAGGF